MNLYQQRCENLNIEIFQGSFLQSRKALTHAFRLHVNISEDFSLRVLKCHTTKVTNYLTHYQQQIPSCEANSSSVRQEIPGIL